MMKSLYSKLQILNFFCVNQDFPKLKRRDIPKAIKSISYTLDIDAIMDFNICPGEIKWE